jgi:hypothetical protein
MSKLPALRLARHAYLDVIANAQGLLRVGGPWLLLSWALLLLARGGSALLNIAADLAVTVGAAAIAVAWHRHILADEPLSARIAPVDARVARYFVLTVILAFLVGAPPLLVLLLTGGVDLTGGADAAAPEGGGPGLSLLLVPVTMLACLYAALRLQLVFPATAIADRAMTPARSWALTQGNGWRLLGGFVLTTLPVAVAAIALTVALSWLADATGSIVLGALADLTAVGNAWLQAPLIASYLAFSYLFVRQQGGGVVPAAAQ